MKMKNFLKSKVGIYRIVIILVLLVSMSSCVLAAEEKVNSYKEYVSSLPEGCFPVPQECFEQAQKEGELDIYDWAAWWPEEIYESFSREFGIKIVRDNFANNNELLAKFKLYPKAPYDFVVIDERRFAPFKKLGALHQLNHGWIPNVNRYLSELYKKTSYDPGYQYAVPYQAVVTTYCWNAKYVDDPRIPSWATLFEPEEKYKEKITLLDDMCEVIGGALIYLGYSWNSDDEEELMEAKKLLLRLKPNLMAFDSWPVRRIINEEAWISQLWQGDAALLNRQLKTVRTALPKEGSLISEGLLSIPAGAPHPAAAHLWINYVFRPKVNALLIETVAYIPTHTAVPPLLSKELREFLPSKEYLEKCEHMNRRAYTGKGLKLRSEIGEELKK